MSKRVTKQQVKRHFYLNDFDKARRIVAKDIDEWVDTTTSLAMLAVINSTISQHEYDNKPEAYKLAFIVKQAYKGGYVAGCEDTWQSNNEAFNKLFGIDTSRESNTDINT